MKQQNDNKKQQKEPCTKENLVRFLNPLWKYPEFQLSWDSKEVHMVCSTGMDFQSVRASMTDTKGKTDTVGSPLSKQLSVKQFHQCNPRIKHLDTILFRFLFGHIWSKAEKQAGKEIHKLLMNESCKFSKIIQ